MNQKNVRVTYKIEKRNFKVKLKSFIIEIISKGKEYYPDLNSSHLYFMIHASLIFRIYK